MSTEDAEEQTEVTKLDRILNALAVYPDRYERSDTSVAEITGASRSYVHQIHTKIDNGEITQNDFKEAANNTLRSQYSKELPKILEEKGVSRTIDGEEDDTIPSFDEDVSVDSLQELRQLMDQYREDAEFESYNMVGESANVATGKYIVADAAVKAIDQLVTTGEIKEPVQH